MAESVNFAELLTKDRLRRMLGVLYNKWGCDVINSRETIDGFFFMPLCEWDDTDLKYFDRFIAYLLMEIMGPIYVQANITEFTFDMMKQTAIEFLRIGKKIQRSNEYEELVQPHLSEQTLKSMALFDLVSYLKLKQ